MMIPELNSTLPSTAMLPHGSFDRAQKALFTSMIAEKKAFVSAPSSTSTETQLVPRADRSRTLEELREDPVYGRLWQFAPEVPVQQSPLDVAREQRLEILARQFEGTELTREDEARIAILTQRLRRLAPRVTHTSWTLAEESIANLEVVTTRLDQIGAKYGL